MEFKSPVITPLLKKPDLDPSERKWYRLISNLTVVSKTLERLIDRRLIDYLGSRCLAYRASHSSETSVLRFLSDILEVLDHAW